MYFAYWYNFTVDGELWRVNQEIERSFDRSESVIENKIEETFEKTIKTEDSVVRTESTRTSARNPLVLEGSRNYVTGKNVTFIVPSTMRRLNLNIKDNVGRVVSSYSLPNSFISIKPNQRLEINIVE